MIQRGERLGFAGEPGETFGILGERLREDLDRNTTIKLRVAGSMDFPHAPATDEIDQREYADAGAWCEAEAQALDLARQAIALVAGGFAEADITITPVEDTAYLFGRWHGCDASLKPLVISGHLDVVEARAADWQRDPFMSVVENGYLYGRGATDMQFDGRSRLPRSSS